VLTTHPVLSYSLHASSVACDPQSSRAHATAGKQLIHSVQKTSFRLVSRASRPWQWYAAQSNSSAATVANTDEDRSAIAGFDRSTDQISRSTANMGKPPMPHFTRLPGRCPYRKGRSITLCDGNSGQDAGPPVSGIGAQPRCRSRTPRARPVAESASRRKSADADCALTVPP